MMNKEELFYAMINYEAGNAHRIQHFLKVHSFALRIGLAEKLDAKTLEILETAAIVHDIGIKPSLEKYGSSAGKYQEIEGPAVAKAMLESLGYPSVVVERVCYLVGHHHTYSAIDGPDYQILVEADFLVNMHEEDMDRDAIQSVFEKIFRTDAGKTICREMFSIQA